MHRSTTSLTVYPNDDHRAALNRSQPAGPRRAETPALIPPPTSRPARLESLQPRRRNPRHGRDLACNSDDRAPSSGGRYRAEPSMRGGRRSLPSRLRVRRRHVVDGCRCREPFGVIRPDHQGHAERGAVVPGPTTAITTPPRAVDVIVRIDPVVATHPAVPRCCSRRAPA